MLTRLEQATDRSAPREPWVERGLLVLKGDFSKKEFPPTSNTPEIGSTIVETVTTAARKEEGGAMEIEADPTTPEQLPEDQAPAVHPVQ